MKSWTRVVCVISDNAIVYYMTQWRENIANQLSVSLTSLDLLGVTPDQLNRYLVTGPSADPDLLRFSAERGIKLIFRDRLTASHPLPNKALITTSTPHQVVMYADLDTVFLKNPGAAFDRCASTGHFFARPDPTEPLYSWDFLPRPMGNFLKNRIGREVWSWLYRRYSPSGNASRVPYLNTGLFVLPGSLLQRFTQKWWEICSQLLRDREARKIYPFFFTFYFYEQLSFSLALQSLELPFENISEEYNFIPISDDLGSTESGYPTICHLVSGVRSWYEGGASDVSGVYGTLKQRVLDVLEVDSRTRKSPGRA